MTGAALLQYRANNLLAAGLDFTTGANAQAYNTLFTQTTYIIGYAGQPQYQFQYQWWIIELQFCIFALTAGLTLFPKFIARGRPVALTFIASALVLVMDNINAIWFLLRNDTAKLVYQEYRIQTAQAGLIMVGIANGLTIIFMGLYEHPIEEKKTDGSVYIDKA